MLVTDNNIPVAVVQYINSCMGDTMLVTLKHFSGAFINFTSAVVTK